jgi:hypothetical protein
MTRTLAIAGVILLALALCGQAQTAAADQYRAGGGVSYDYYGKTGFASLLDIDARTAPASNIWYHVALEMTQQQAILKPGAEYDLVKSGYWGVALFGDAGLATGSGATLGAFSGGGKLSYDFGARLSKGASHYYAEFAVKINYITGTGTAVAAPNGTVTTNSPAQPVFSVAFSKGF